MKSKHAPRGLLPASPAHLRGKSRVKKFESRESPADLSRKFEEKEITFPDWRHVILPALLLHPQHQSAMATTRMTPLARHLQLRFPSSWLLARSITTSHALVPPQASTSKVEADLAAVPSMQDTTATTSTASSSSTQQKLPYFITRTERNKSLPVYSNIRAGGTRQEVLIRHVSGNIEVRLPYLSVTCRLSQLSTCFFAPLHPSIHSFRPSNETSWLTFQQSSKRL